jgi:transcriptional regulator with PAS, ATPase and Fis domain
MDESTRRLLACKNWGLIIFDAQFKILEIDDMAKTLLKGNASFFSKTPLLEAFPEFVGNEKSIQEVISRKTGAFRLDFVNRTGTDGKVQFLELIAVADQNPGQGVLVIEDVTERAKMLQELNQQKYELLLYKSGLEFQKKFLSESILGNSPAIQQARETIHKLSRFPGATVLLTGESGTGKNLVARVLHYSSMPADAPFVDINCASLPDNLVESELFGYEKGAFTNAVVSRPGLLQEAEGGTIFLDEIGELPLNLQAKLLSVLETKRFRRLGSNKPIEVNARIITATNRDLKKEVTEKNFRDDLYHRLNVVSLTLPPLRSLGEDVLLIAEHFLKIFNVEFKKKVKGFTSAAKSALLHYHWPGNVRELSNCLERAMIFVETEYVDEADLIITYPDDLKRPEAWIIPHNGISLEEVERKLMTSALKQAGGNKSEAARLLGLTRDTLRYRLQKHGFS